MSVSTLFSTESEGTTLIVVPRENAGSLAAYNVAAESETLVICTSLSSQVRSSTPTVIILSPLTYRTRSM